MSIVHDVYVPDLGNVNNVPVIEILVSPGDLVVMGAALVVLESDKTTMDVPSPIAGTVKAIQVSMGDKVSAGSLILSVETSDDLPVFDALIKEISVPPCIADNGAGTRTGSSTTTSVTAAFSPSPLLLQAPPVDSTWENRTEKTVGGALFIPYCGPAVRKLARELGVNLAEVPGSGNRARLMKEDVVAFVKRSLSAPRPAASVTTSTGSGLDLLPWPTVDFAKFGSVERRPLTRIQSLSGANLARNWVRIPHVTSFDEADITELEVFRQTINRERKEGGVKLTLLAFVLKVVAATLKVFPQFNASLDGEDLVLKSYVHIGFAVDTPNGLVVPVIRDVDRKGVVEIAREVAGLAERARTAQLKADEMQGGSFTVSSLGSIGGTAFTPIINAPEAAILGITMSAIKPVWDGDKFVPRRLLPISLSWDHRVVDGVAAARFNRVLVTALGDFKRLVL